MRVPVRMASVALAALGLCGATAAAASAAEPAFFECAKISGGAFKDKLCSEPGAGKGKFELQEGIGASGEVSTEIHQTRIEGERNCSRSTMAR